MNASIYFTVEKTKKHLSEIHRAIHRAAYPITDFKYRQDDPDLDALQPEYPEFGDHDWANFTVGQTWGGYDRIAWFRTWLDLPPGWEDKKLALRFLVGPRDGGNSTAETLLFVNGVPLQAIDVWHEEAWLPPELLREGRILIALRAWSGVHGVPDQRRFKLAQLVWIDEPTENFYFRCDTLLKAVQSLDENDLRRIKLLQALDSAFRQIDFIKPGSDPFYDSIRTANRTLGHLLDALELPDGFKPRVRAVGHSHLDMAWLWRLSHTREKAVRTFATALHMMRQYPEFRFLHSSPQLYKFLHEDAPEIFALVRDRIQAGQWEITGGMWVEADTNLTSGESLVRQFLLGRRFIRQEFGQESTVLWLPDVFGYSWALPQIARKSGIRAFMTTKISWSQYNRFPYDTFYWRGTDGTDLLTHFVTTPDSGTSPFYTYNGLIEPKQVLGIWNNYRQKEINDELLLPYGWGDGGGGPTKEMIESARNLKNLPGIPLVEQGTAEEYFRRLESRIATLASGAGNSEGRAQIPVWDGELYLEYHRGTYTSQARIKRENRKTEFLYHDTEWLCAMAAVLNPDFHYPAQNLRDGWERILLNQFHDILPGSSIRQVYEDSHKQYAQAAAIASTAIGEAQASLLQVIPAERDSLVIFNSLSWDRASLLEIDLQEDQTPFTLHRNIGSRAPYQVVHSESRRQVLIESDPVPSLGYAVHPLAPASETEFQENELVVTTDFLENRYYRIELDPQGRITSLFDKRSRREVLPPNVRANVFQAFEDKPMNFDAWDIDIYYQQKMREITHLIESKVEETGPVRGALLLRWRFYDSTITQRLTIYRRSPRIDFRTEVDWHERQVLLKVAFPAALRATRATYDIQFGSIERSTHWNTSWDYARFEAVAHKWVDLSEGDYGLALMNDCKYGHDVKDGVIRLTLIKSPIEPDETADQGRHEFTYSLLPHSGDWCTGGVVPEAYDLNVPMRTMVLPAGSGGSLPDRFSLCWTKCDHIVIETVKQSEDEPGVWVVRLYENQQRRSSRVDLHFGMPIQYAQEVNLVEEDPQPAHFEPGFLRFAITPFEIKTFKVWLGNV